METVERFGVSMSPQLLNKFDQVIANKGYTSRSEALRDIIRNFLVETEWESADSEVIGTVTIVYNHETHDLSDTLTEMQHIHHKEIVCTTHVHLDEHNCLETIVLRGSSGRIRAIADRLISTKGVKHGKLVCTTTGKELF